MSGIPLFWPLTWTTDGRTAGPFEKWVWWDFVWRRHFPALMAVSEREANA
jgi:hypothetical protein